MDFVDLLKDRIIQVLLFVIVLNVEVYNNYLFENPLDELVYYTNLWISNISEYPTTTPTPTPTPTPSPTPSPTPIPTATPTQTPKPTPTPNPEFSFPVEYAVSGIAAIAGVAILVLFLRRK